MANRARWDASNAIIAAIRTEKDAKIPAHPPLDQTRLPTEGDCFFRDAMQNLAALPDSNQESRG